LDQTVTRGDKLLSEALSSKAGRPKSLEKRRQILEAASDLFLEQGFSGCSMDMVAKHSTVSKQTVYSHFSNKDALFIAVIDNKCKEYQLDTFHLEQEKANLEEVLDQVGLKIVRLLHDEKVIAMYRVVIGEVSCNPHVAELFYHAGPQHSLKALARCFQMHAEIALSDEAAQKCAISFFNLLKGEFHMRSILGLEFALSEKQKIEHVKFAISQVEPLFCKPL
jgi:TetR/AcrR family transcriptional repressor of mexJK operon